MGTGARVEIRSPQHLVSHHGGEPRSGELLLSFAAHAAHVNEKRYNRFGGRPPSENLQEKRADLTWDVVKRLANQFRLNQAGEYGNFYERANHNETITQHSHEHGRRVKLHIEAILSHIPELAQKEIPGYIYLALALFPYLHDSAQQSDEQRNLDETTNRPPKWGHALAGGLQILAQTDNLAKVLGLTHAEARKVTGAAAYMMIKHDEPTKLMEAMAGNKPKTGQSLLEQFEGNQLKLENITGAQLVEITIAKREKEKIDDGTYVDTGFVTAETPFGLHPTFEKTYKAELEALATDNSPLITDFVEATDREGLELFTQLAIHADMFDMFMPAEEAMLRKLGGDRSLKRPFFRPDETLEQLMELVNGHIGTRHNKIDSDSLRQLWEEYHPLDVNPNGIIAQSDYVQNLMRKTVIKAAIRFKDLGTDLMRQDPSSFIAAYDRRIHNLEEKMMTTAEIQPHDRVRRRGALQDRGVSTQRLSSLEAERDRVVTQLMDKFKAANYSEADVTAFQAIMDHTLEDLVDRYEVTSAELATFRDELDRGDLSDMPFKTYDSSHTLHSFRSRRGPRTYHEQFVLAA